MVVLCGGVVSMIILQYVEFTLLLICYFRLMRKQFEMPAFIALKDDLTKE